MRLKRIELKQICQFSLLNIEFKAIHAPMPITLFLGDKNTGKTTVLKHIFQGLSWFAGRLKDPRTAGIIIADGSIKMSALQATLDLEIEYPPELGTIIDDTHAQPAQDYLCHWQVKKTKVSEHTIGLSRVDTVHLEQLISRYQKQVELDPLFSIPCLAYYPAERFVNEVNLQTKNIASSITPIHNAYDLISIEFSTFNKFFEWFRDITDLENAQTSQLFRHYLHHNLRFQNQSQFEQAFSNLEQAYRLGPQRCLNSLRSALQTVMPEIQDIYIEFQPKLRIVVIRNEHIIPFSQLSQTDKTWIAMIGDIVRRMCILNPQSLHPCLENDGIVIIDAIDNQLDTQHRQHILERLHTAFPQVQFIVSAQQEDIVDALPEVECYRLQQRQAIALDLKHHLQDMQQLYQHLNIENENVSSPLISSQILSDNEQTLCHDDILNYAQQLSDIELQQLQQQLQQLSGKQDSL